MTTVAIWSFRTQGAATATSYRWNRPNRPASLRKPSTVSL